jgi:hypothetical protein
MSEIPLGLTFDRDDEGFILRRKDNDGSIATFRISEDEFPGLKATISLWMDRMIQASQAVSGSVQAVVAHPVARVRALPDALQENVLLTVEAPSGEQMTLSFPPAIADYIVSEVGRVRDELRPDRSKPS